MNFIERVMRAMTHINIGVALGLAAWVLWSGWQVVTAHTAPADPVGQGKALIGCASQPGTGRTPPRWQATSPGRWVGRHEEPRRLCQGRCPA